MENEKKIVNIILLLTLVISLVVPNSEYLVILIPFSIFLIKFRIIDSIFYFILYLGISGNGNYLLEEINIPFSQIFIPFILITYTVIFMRKNLNKVNFKFVFTLSLFFLIYLIFGSINGSYSSVINLFFYFILILIYIVSLILVLDNQKLKDIIQVIIYSIIFMCFISINLWIFNDNNIYSNDYFSRAGGVFGNPNLLAQNILLMTPAIFTGVRKFDFKLLFSVSLISLTIIITQSRGSLLLLFLVIMIYIFLDNKAKLFEKIKFGIITIFIALISLIFIDDAYFERFSIGSNSRLDALCEGVQGFFSSPFGVGIGNTANNELQLSSHNNYIHIISEIGISGIILLSIIMIYFFVSWKYSYIYKKTFTFYLIPILFIVSFFTHNLLTNHIVYIIILISFYEIKLKSEV